MTRKGTTGKGGGTQNQQQKQKNNNTAGGKKESLPVRVLRAIPRGTFRTVGGALLGPPGAAIGHGISTLTGFGDYKVNGVEVMSGGQLPVMDNVLGKKVVRHKEFVYNVHAPETPADFVALSLPINVANSTLFPWLSGIAKHYQRYKIKSMVFGYETASTDFGNSGTVAIAVQYDPDAPDFVTMGGILNSQFAGASKPSVSFAVPVECNAYTATGMLIVDEANSRLTSFGRVTIATEGLQVPALTVIGRLHVSYEVELTMTQAQAERLGGGGNTNNADLDNFNANTKTWEANGTVETSNPGALSKFLALKGAELPDTEVTVQSTNVGTQWAIRPKLTFVTGGRYLITFMIGCTNGDAVTWETGYSTAGETSATGITIYRTRNNADFTSGVASTGGYYIIQYIAIAQPGSWLAPYAATRIQGNVGNMAARLSVTKLT